MKIKQEKNGNILITRDNGEILHILPSIYIHQHPRKKNAILITDSIVNTNENLGISILASTIHSIGNENFTGDIKSLKEVLSKRIVVNGTVPPPKKVPLTKENDPNYVAYLQANTYEKLLTYVKKHQFNVGGKQYHKDGRLDKEEFYCQFETFNIRVFLQYQYKKDPINLIDTILMSGSTTYVLKPKKVYQYDAKNTITGYVYQEAF